MRTSALLIRLVLAWFVLTLGVSVASPVVHPQTLEMVCTASGDMKVVAIDAHGNAVQASHHTLDCPMCLAASLPAPADGLSAAHTPPPGPARHSLAEAPRATTASAPLPPRGPPARS